MQLKNCNQNILLLFIVLLLYPPSNVIGSELAFTAAQKRVLKKNAGLHSIEQAVKAAESRRAQAGAWPNPEAEVMLENFGRNEIEIAITQPFELGGKRKARIALATKGTELVTRELEYKKLAITCEIIRRFVPLLSLQQRQMLIDSMIAISEEGIANITKRIEAGATKAVDALRAEVEKEELILEKKALKREFMQAKHELAALWSDTAAAFDAVSGIIKPSIPIPAKEELRKTMLQHPEILALKCEQEIARAQISEVKAEAFPEMALTGGYLRNNEAGEHAPLAGISLSLPFFNRNKGTRQAKEHELSSMRFAIKQHETERIVALSKLHSEISGLQEEFTTLLEKIAPKAQQAYAALTTYYTQGSASILEVLEAQAHLMEIRLSIIDTHARIALLASDLMELTGHTITIIQ